ncbi:unnamed protein product [Ceratitis capitata]|uniref:(Mediterranean fruit fly) hypothetical protein n=1 Tax=Ceratitis capitata TaxID=7213 RepID=W8C8Y3_CERCA|nr:unnamed protein product [Ceratitis capitata]
MEIGYLQEVKAVIKSLVLSYPGDITVDALNRDYRSTEGIQIPHRKLGFQTLEEFLRSIPDTITVFGSGSTAIVGNVRNQKSDHIHQMVCQQKKARTRPKAKPPRLRGTYSDFSNRPQPAGQKVHPVSKRISSDNLPTSNIRFSYSMNRSTPRYSVIKCQELELPAKYAVKKQIVDKEPIVISEKSNKSTREKIIQPKSSDNEKYDSQKIAHDTILQKLVDVCKIDDKETNQKAIKKTIWKKEDAYPAIHFQQKVNTKHFSSMETNASCILNVPNAFVLNNSSYENKRIDDIDEAVPAYAADNLVYRMDFPESTVTFGIKIPSYKLPEKYRPGDVIGLFISEIHSPYKFWFHIYKEHNELDTLMLQIEHFYTSLEPRSFCVPRVCICPGQVCAALYKNLWHRAEILSPVIENKAKVLFVDYGTVSEVSVDDIKFLLTSFAKLPQQAIRGSLSYICPKNLHWCQESIHAFLEMTFELMLYGKISEIHEKKRTIYMVLCDTNKEQVVQINKQLVDKGFALYDEEWLKSEKVNSLH